MLEHGDDAGLGAQIADSLDRLLQARVDADGLRRAEAGTFAADLWEALSDLGLPEALAPCGGGSELPGWTDLAPALTVLGRHACPVPLGEHMIACAALREAGLELPDGVIGLNLRPRGVGSDSVAEVRWGCRAGHILLDAGSGIALAQPVGSGDCSASRQSLSREPHRRFPDGTLRILATGAIGGPDLATRGALLAALQIAGAARRVLEMTVAHANYRVQFGRPISRFQAVQHLLATMANDVAAVDTLGHAAARMMDRPGASQSAAIAVAAAKARASAAAGRIAAGAHQVHAAIGVTEAFALQFYTRRLCQWRDDFGSEFHWHAWLGARARETGSAGLWDFILRHSDAAL